MLLLSQATLAAIVVVALKGLYLQVRDIYKYYILSWTDMVSDIFIHLAHLASTSNFNPFLPCQFVWIVVFLATLLIGLDIGLAIGVLFSLFVVVVRTILPYSPSLGETRAWHYPPDEKLEDDEFDEEDLKVNNLVDRSDMHSKFQDFPCIAPVGISHPKDSCLPVQRSSLLCQR